MGDFHQNGIITTLHNLSKRPLEAMESELVEFSKKETAGIDSTLALLGVRG